MKTPEEIKKGLECCLGDTHAYHCDECPYADDESEVDDGCGDNGIQLLDDALALIQQLEAQVPKWISVVEREPPEGSYVLAAGDDEDEVPAVAHIEKGDWAAVWAENFGESVHSYWRGGAMFWMPLPEPPKEDDHATD